MGKFPEGMTDALQMPEESATADRDGSLVYSQHTSFSLETQNMHRCISQRLHVRCEGKWDGSGECSNRYGMKLG